MRNALILSLATAIAVVLGAACNSKEGLISRLPKPPASSPQSPQPKQSPADNARRITAEELHDLWEKGKVLVVDTRNEPSFKQGHIKGAILIPSNDFAAKANELPRDKMIVTYCT
jgi:3-mercaptopyruvate sulfurtransferase SseA